MATLISQYNSDGTRRRCDARCYNAKHHKCTCICGGANHGVGLQKAMENTKLMAEKMLENAAERGVEYAKQVLEEIKKQKAAI